jgi:hypothetical protein
LHKILAVGLLALAQGVCGCGLGNRTYGTSWTADLDRLPDSECVKGAISSIEQVSHIEPWNDALGVYLKSEKYTEAQLQQIYSDTESLMRTHGSKNYKVPPDISVFLSSKRGKPRFAMSYMGWRKPADPAEIVAHAIITRIASRCDLPGLPARAVEKQDSIPTPYFFNI